MKTPNSLFGLTISTIGITRSLIFPKVTLYLTIGTAGVASETNTVKNIAVPLHFMASLLSQS
ncbi:hypothetical protein [Sphingobacterium paucimobilis]|uniref:hypothetical protein n=1 Tax=Sphingobacterium paucimobilis TaxID=1385985 RepID=UPI0011840620|nr:hypothetical protein [Sphingobacterium paucimobilis]